MKREPNTPNDNRRGSTLVIVIALLGLLTFTGMVFFTFASQERVASEFFSEAAKIQHNDPTDVWPHMLEQIIVGAPEQFRGSVLYSPTRRYSLVRNLVGSDIYPGNADGIDVQYSSEYPAVGINDENGVSFLEFVDSPAAHGALVRATAPEPDVDYTYPDINNLFLAYQGWAIAENSGGGSQRQLPVFIPSFFRPQYMRQPFSGSGTLSLGATFEGEFRTNRHWAYAYQPGATGSDPPTAVAPTNANRNTVLFPARSFRPHPSHISGVTSNGTTVLRYITEDEATALGLGAGGFPFLPEDSNSNGINGDLGLWTGNISSATTLDDFELDADPDGDGINEAIWLDLHFPIQEFTDSTGATRSYVVMFAVTIHELDALFNLNVHGNLAGLPQTGTLPQAASNGDLSSNFVSRSHQGLGPNEVNPEWGLRRNVALNAETEEHMHIHFGAAATNTLEQANIEWIWALMGRGQYDDRVVTRDAGTGAITSVTPNPITDLFGGRWGDKQMLYNALEVASTRLRIAEMPGPGRAGNIYGTSFGGRFGVDDNQNAREGDAFVELVDHDNDPTTADVAVVRQRPYGHPMSFSGRGQRTQRDYASFDAGTNSFDLASGAELWSTDNPLLPMFLRQETQIGPKQWPGYIQYGAASTLQADPVRYGFGVDGARTASNTLLGDAAGDDLSVSEEIDRLFEDPLETIFDHDIADRDSDGIASIGDLVALQWRDATLSPDAAKDKLSEHLSDLMPHALAEDSDQREMFTTLSNSLRYIAMRRSSQRAWEYTADSDGFDQDGNGFPDGDGLLEFPPSYNQQVFGPDDPFRPQVRRLLTNEIGEGRNILGVLPLSVNHILDVDRTDETPAEGTAAFLRYMQRSGLRFRSVTEHPHYTGVLENEPSALTETDVPTIEALADSDPNTVASEANVPYPPTNFGEQEFWARRDRQQLARDIYVLLYTLGGAESNGTGGIVNYTTNGSAYTEVQLRRMAQFAVNMVDAMDNDDVITKFEYDKDLTNGWNLDDDAFSNDATGASTVTSAPNQGLYPEDTDDRGVVFGVEAQQLAFSEVLGITSNEVGAADHPATLQDDTAGDRHHLFIELRNMLPNTLDLSYLESANELTGAFRIARFDRQNASDRIALPDQPNAAITLTDDAGTVNGGGLFTISAASDTSTSTSDFYVDYDLSGDFNCIAPFGGPAVTGPTGMTALCDVDVIESTHASRYVMTNSSQAVTTAGGAFFDGFDPTMDYGGNQAFTRLQAASNAGGQFGTTPTEAGFDLVIQRRLNPHMPSLESSAGQIDDVNPWVEVDRIRVVFKELGLQDGDTAAELTGTRLENLRSSERVSELNDTSRVDFGGNSVAEHQYNSLTQPFNSQQLTDPTMAYQPDNTMANFNDGLQTTVWQPHFDREFASTGELLNVPAFGPNLLTQRLRHSQLTPDSQVEGATLDPENIAGASAMFLRPDYDPTGTTTDNDNRWYRLFQFVEVPSRVHRMVGNYLNQIRTPGKINLNMIRHLEVFAGLVDDPLFVDLDNDRLNSPFSVDSTPGVVGTALDQDRYLNFIEERDGATVGGYYDPTPANTTNGDDATSFLMPGVPGSTPFRSSGYTADAADDNGIDRTILRNRIDDDGATADRHWLEVGTRANHNAPNTASTTVERHQILSKILNNTTTTSNAFVVFAQASYFEAIEDPATGFVRVGGRINIADGTTSGPGPDGWQQRAVFVIDRTDAYQALDLGTGDFDWQRLVKFEAEIE
ncbi:MAG: hypothetical protein NXI04_29230 [Planctomycetaceae bacterium]|nr:hypothetical protein [Planctomycetaceae bacterium]